MQRRPGRLAGLAPLMLLVVLAAGGCGRVEATARAQEALLTAGLDGPVVSVHERGGTTTVQVRYNSRAGDEAALRAEQDIAARVVWANATVPLDSIKVTPDGNPSLPAADSRVYSREDLLARFGARPAGLDQPPAGGGPRAIAFGLAVALTALALVAAATTIGGLVLRARLRRRRELAAATAWPSPNPATDQAPGQPPGQPTGQAPPRKRGRAPAAPPRRVPRGAQPPPGSWPAPPDA